MQKLRKRFLPNLVLLAVVISTRSSAFHAEDDVKQEPFRVLLLTGSDVPAHDWRATTPITREILERSGAFEVFLSEEIGVLESSTLARYDVIVLNLRNRPTEPLSDTARNKLSSFVGGGGGLVALHFAVNAFRDWPEYARMIGRIWKVKRQGGSSGHGPKGPFDVRVHAEDHPVAQDLRGFTIDDELYSNLEGDTAIRVVADAHSTFSGRVEPIAWTCEHGKGRVFVTSLGHDVEARKNAGFAALLVRGCSWAAGASKD